MCVEGDDEGVVVVPGVGGQAAQVGNRVRRAGAPGKRCVTVEVPQLLLLWAVVVAPQGVLCSHALPEHEGVPSREVIRSRAQVRAPQGQSERRKGELLVYGLREHCVQARARQPSSADWLHLQEYGAGAACPEAEDLLR